VSFRARLLLVGLVLIAGALATWAVFSLTEVLDEERPGVFDVVGDHPGDLFPDLDIEDNVRHYGLPHDLTYRFQTNSLGFRGPEPTEGKPVILVLGDSFAFGMGVDEGQTFPDYLRRALGDRATVHNTAVPGYTIVDQIEQWQEKLADLQPSLVLICHTASDLKEMARPTSFRRLMKHDDEDPTYNDPEVAAVVARADGDKAEATRRFYTFSQQQLRERLGAAAPVELAALRAKYAEQVVALSQQTRVAVILWVNGYGMGGLDVGPLKQELEQAEVPVFEGMASMMAQRELGPERLFLPDKHFSPEGNRLAAEQAASWIRAEQLLDL